MPTRRAVAGVVLAALAVAGCSRPGRTVEMGTVPASTIDADAPSDVVVPTAAPSTPVIRTGPLTPLDPTRIRPEDATAIIELGRSGAGVPGHAGAHGHGGSVTELEIPLLTGDAGIFAGQWLAAVASVSRYDSIAEIRDLGYVRASAPGPGVGTHWVRWSQIARPFDPALPAMLLIDETADPAVLVGYSYWVQSPTEPIGFAGSNDRWHQHTGLCVVNGWVDREEAAGPEACAGTYLAGGDLWMLHAWVVPGFENRLGRFASIHPVLCPSRLGTPDIVQCPDTGSSGLIAGSARDGGGDVIPVPPLAPVLPLAPVTSPVR